MLVKIVILFLALLAALVWVGSKLRHLGIGGGRTRGGRLAAGRCKGCGAPRAGKGACPCGKA